MITYTIKDMAKWCKIQRKSMGLTLRQVEKKTKISNSFLCQFERGNREISLSRFLKLAALYGISVKVSIPKEKR